MSLQQKKTSMDITKELASFKKKFDRELTRYLDRVIAETKKHDPFATHTLKYFKRTVLAGGKRIRPAVMFFGYHAAGGRNEKELLKTAVGIELIHAFLLMHDDIIDRDNLRHGVPTMHAHYEAVSKKLFGGRGGAIEPEHFGLSVGVIVGDLVYSLGNRAVFESNFPARNIVAALKKMSDIVGLTVVGEMQDVYIEHEGQATEKKILAMYEKKTARYTFEGPFHLGAILAGGKESQQQAFSAYAIPLGVAFQLQDDLLGLFGSEKKIGKPVGSDVAEGKITVPVAYARAHATAKQKVIIARTLGKEKLTKAELVAFRDVIEQTGGRAHAEELAQKYLHRARRALNAVQLSPKARDFFANLTDYLENRSF